MALTTSGDAVAVWAGPVEGELVRLSNRYDHLQGWSATEVLAEMDLSESACQALVIDPERRALAVWEGAASDYGLWSSMQRPDEAWAAPERVDSGARAIAGHALALGPEGDAIAVWRERGDYRLGIWANHHDAETGWGSEERIYTEELQYVNGELRGSDTNTLSLGMDAAGNAVAAWGGVPGSKANTFLVADPSPRWAFGARIVAARPVEALASSARQPRWRPMASPSAPMQSST